MAELEDKLGAILGNPQMMQQIMAMAQAMNQPQNPKQEPPQETAQPQQPEIDPALLGKLAGFAGQGGIDKDQRMLLKALGPYLSSMRIHKLEKAMQAAKLARLASSFLSQGGLSLLTGR